MMDEEAPSASPGIDPTQPVEVTEPPADNSLESHPQEEGGAVDGAEDPAIEANPESPVPEKPEMDPENEQDPTLLFEPVPPAFEVFCAMAAAIGIRKATDPLGCDMVNTPYHALPETTKALFRVPKDLAITRAAQLLEPFKKTAATAAPLPGATNEKSLAHGFRDLLVNALNRLSNTLTPAFQKKRELLRQQAATTKMEFSWAALSGAAARLQNDPRVAALNRAFQEGRLTGDTVACEQARKDFLRVSAQPDLREAVHDFNTYFGSWIRDCEEALGVGVADQATQTRIASRLGQLQSDLGVVQQPDQPRGLYENIALLIDRFVALWNGSVLGESAMTGAAPH